MMKKPMMGKSQEPPMYPQQSTNAGWDGRKNMMAEMSKMEPRQKPLPTDTGAAPTTDRAKYAKKR